MMRREVKLSAVLAAMLIALSACNVSTPFSNSGATPAATATAAGATVTRGSAVASSAANVQTVQSMPPLAATVVVLVSPTAPPAATPVPMTPLPPTKPPASSATIAAMQSMQPAGAVTQVVTVTADESVNMRSGPATDTDVVTLIPPGTEVAVLEPTVKATDNGTPWVKVSINSQTGYVRSDLVGPPHAPTTPPAAMTGAAPAASGAAATMRPAAMTTTTGATATP